MILAKGDCLYFQFTFGVESELAPILQRWIDRLSTSWLMHFHNVVTMQVTMAVQMSKVKNISIYKNINYYVFQGMQKRKQ